MTVLNRIVLFGFGFLLSLGLVAYKPIDRQSAITGSLVEQPGEIVVAVRSTSAEMNESQFLEAHRQLIFGPFDIDQVEKILTNKKQMGFLHVFKLSSATELRSNRSLVSFLESMSAVAWAEPVMDYEGDLPMERAYSGRALEEGPNDEEYPDQYHLRVMQAAEAWKHATGEGVIVAVTDNGFELDHEDLTNQWHVNAGEIPDNDIDDDGNGYVDDVIGYDFNDEDADVNPKGFFADDHGTHVSGIIAAEANNEVGVAGIAPGAKVMPLKFTGSRTWSSDVIAETYKYAADNGAKIITTSYYIDKWVGNKLFEEAIQYVYDRGIIHFNSAGNGYKKNPDRQAFGELVLVCSTEANEEDEDLVADYSNSGWGIDVCAPGGGDVGILSTSTNGKYKRVGGTSMSSPAAAAVAALIWSKNPNYTRDQVLATLYGSSDDIDELNGDYPAGYLGAGRVNALKAVTFKKGSLPLASISEVKANLDSDEGTNTLEIYFSKKSVLKPENIRDLLNYRLTYSQDSIFGNGDDRAIPLELENDFLSNSNRLVLKVGNARPGTFKLRVQGVLEDVFGRRWDGNKDGVPGGSFIEDIVLEDPDTGSDDEGSR